jgi:asparagine synthetase B (glutamine-hydrolysing)
VEELDRLFRQAVGRQLISDVEIGSYLSGGMDSGSIAAIAGQSLPNLKTFTCGFDLSSASGLELSFDERNKAEAMSARFKTEHYEMVLKAGDMERFALPNHSGAYKAPILCRDQICKDRFAIAFSARHQRPDYARQFIGQGNRRDFGRAARYQFNEPRAARPCRSAYLITAIAPTTSICLR